MKTDTESGHKNPCPSCKGKGFIRVHIGLSERKMDCLACKGSGKKK